MSTLIEPAALTNPVEKVLRNDRIPTIWCPGCGLGTTVNSFAYALMASGADLKKTAIVSGIGCSGRVSGYVQLDSFHTTHGRAIPFATGLKLANPELTVVVYSGDGDLTSIGGNHLIHAARRNMDLLVVCVNNMIYAMTGGQAAATTPGAATSTTTPYGSFEPELNIPQLVDAAGACAIVLESMMPEVAEAITGRVRASTIGIGAGRATDGQVLVTPDLTGGFPWFRPPFAKARAAVADEISRAAREYIAEVRGA